MLITIKNKKNIKMKNLFFKSIYIILVMLVGIKLAVAQQSSNTINYKITYDAISSKYTAWVVPNYNVPNANNALSTEKGATAQFTIVVPKDFVIQNITDVKGVWDKAPLKSGPGVGGQNWTGYGLDPNLNYYVIGKSPSETDYGTFISGQAVALFTFSGSSCFGPVSVLAPNNLFITAADALYSLNVANSFYSRSGQPAGGNQNPLEQFSNVSGLAATCAGPSANADVNTATSGVLKNITVLANDKNADGTNVTDFTKITTPILSTLPTKGTATVKSDGSIDYTPTVGATGSDTFVYTICDKANTTLCDTAKVTVAISSIPTQSVDIAIRKTVNKSTAALNDILTYTIVVKNNGGGIATNIVVKDSLGTGLEITSVSTTKGTFNYPNLTIPSLVVGDSAILTLSARVLVEGISFNYAVLKSLDQLDPVVTNNNSSICSTVPMTLCSGDAIELAVPSTFTNVIWYRNGIQVGTGNVYLATTSGNYTTSATNVTCPATGCCPVVILVQDCCPKQICVPVNVTKVRK